MSAFTIDGEVLSVYQFSGFDKPDEIQLVSVLSTTSSTHDQVLQSGSSPMPQATLSGRTSDPEVIALLREIRGDSREAELVEPDNGAHTIVITSLSVSGATPATFMREWTMTVVEVRAQGSSSGS